MAERIKNDREKLLMGDDDFYSINSVFFFNPCEAYGLVLAFFLSSF